MAVMSHDPFEETPTRAIPHRSDCEVVGMSHPNQKFNVIPREAFVCRNLAVTKIKPEVFYLMNRLMMRSTIEFPPPTTEVLAKELEMPKAKVGALLHKMKDDGIVLYQGPYKPWLFHTHNPRAVALWASTTTTVCGRPTPRTPWIESMRDTIFDYPYHKKHKWCGPKKDRTRTSLVARETLKRILAQATPEDLYWLLQQLGFAERKQEYYFWAEKRHVGNNKGFGAGVKVLKRRLDAQAGGGK